MTLHITGDDAADQLLTDDPLAPVIGMLLDQQVHLETAYSGPHKIAERIGTLDPAAIADYDPDALAEVFRQTPAVHRFPATMAKRVQALCQVIVDEWDGDAAAIWTRPAAEHVEAPDGMTVRKRLRTLPGFSDKKARFFLALLGKQYGYDGENWRKACAPYGEPDGFRSVADIVSPESRAKVHAHVARHYRRRRRQR